MYIPLPAATLCEIHRQAGKVSVSCYVEVVRRDDDGDKNHGGDYTPGLLSLSLSLSLSQKFHHTQALGVIAQNIGRCQPHSRPTLTTSLILVVLAPSRPTQIPQLSLTQLTHFPQRDQEQISTFFKRSRFPLLGQLYPSIHNLHSSHQIETPAFPITQYPALL